MQSLPNQTARKIYTVSKLTRGIKSLLEDKYRIIWLLGEISNIRIPASGHAYFNLKDKKSQISAVMFRGQLGQLKFDLENGAEIIAMGRLSVYEPRGTYQIILEYVEPHGIGALQIAFEQLKQKLDQEGLFDPSHKKALPFIPQKIGVITSPTGAVIKDILRVLGRRFPDMDVDVLPVRVQGEGADQEIVEALTLANQHSQCDLIILARGGGSFEDMAVFNSEVVARAIFDSQKPVVSAIGHETDFTISDFVSDLRAATPSAAAEMVAPVKVELKGRCFELYQRSRLGVQRVIEMQRARMVLARNRHPLLVRRLQNYQMRMDDLMERLLRGVGNFQKRQVVDCQNSIKRLLYNKPDRYITSYKSKLELSIHRIKQEVRLLITQHQEQLKTLLAVLQALNPTAILMRGYSITRTLPQRDIVFDARQVKRDDLLEIQLAKGTIKARVQHKPNNK